MNRAETVGMGEAPVSKDLVEKEEKRKAELKKMTGEQYGSHWEMIQQTLDKADSAFQEVHYSDRSMQSSVAHALKKIEEALKVGDVTVAQEVLAELDKEREDFRLRRNMHPSRVDAVMHITQDFLEYFGLKNYVTLTDKMGPEEIKKAINLGYEAKMWELTNRLEE